MLRPNFECKTITVWHATNVDFAVYCLLVIELRWIAFNSRNILLMLFTFPLRCIVYSELDSNGNASFRPLYMCSNSRDSSAVT